MTLTEIEYGSLASSAVLNSNFQFLQNKITELSALITSETSSFSSSVATLNNSVSELLGYKNSFIPIGSIIISQNSQIPVGFLLCDGSSLLRTQYQSLFNVIGTTYGATDNSHFSLPNLLNRTVFGSSYQHPVGTYLNSGLPNISGSMEAGLHFDNFDTGAFQGQGNGNMIGGSGIWNKGVKTCVFNASASNPIYGASSIVQPPAVVTNFCIKY